MILANLGRGYVQYNNSGRSTTMSLQGSYRLLHDWRIQFRTWNVLTNCRSILSGSNALPEQLSGSDSPSPNHGSRRETKEALQQKKEERKRRQELRKQMREQEKERQKKSGNVLFLTKILSVFVTLCYLGIFDPSISCGGGRGHKKLPHIAPKPLCIS